MAITFDENERRMRQASRNVWKRPPVQGAAPGQYGGSDMPHGPVSPSAPQYSDNRAVTAPRGPMPMAEMPKPVMTPGAPPPGTAVGPSLRPNWTMPGAAPTAPATTAPGTAVVPSTRPNWTMPDAAAPQALPAPQQQSLGGRLRGAIAGVQPVISGAVAGAGGAATAAMVNSARQGQLNTAPAFVPQPAQPGQIPVNPADVAPPAAAGSLLNQSETLRNVGNVVNAMTGIPVAPIASGLTRAGAALSKLPQLERAAQPAALAGAAAKGYVAGDAAFPGVASAAPSAPEALRQPFTDPLGGDKGGSAAAVAPKVDLTGKIVKGTDANGNATYSGSNVKFGADIVDQDGKVLNTSDPNNPNWRNGFGVSGGGGGGGGDVPGEAMRVEQRLAAQYAAQNATAPGPTYTPTSGELGIRGTAFGFSDPEARSREIDFKQSLRGMSPRMRAQAIMQEQEQQSRAAIAAEGNATQRRGQDIGASTTLRGQDISASTSRYGTDVNASTQRRGQDFELAGREATLRGQSRGNDIAAQRLQYDMATGERKWAAERGDKSLEQRAARETQLQKKFEDLAVTGQDDKGGRIVDQNLVAHHRQQFERAAATMGLNGMHELSNTDEQRLLQASHLLNKVNSVGGVLPWRADTLKTMDASDLIGLKKDPNSGDYVVANPKSRVRGAVIPKHLVEGEKATNWPMAGLNTSATTRYRDLVMGDTR